MERVSPSSVSPTGPHRRAGPMRVVETRADLRQALQVLPRPLGLVPTMGYLHEGHLALVRRARRENASVAVSIFVNPTQFGPHEDYHRYPRDLPRDLALLDGEGVDLVFAPSVEEMYPEGFQTWVEPGPLARPLEGACRPGHFRGVCTVVLKLFNLFRPERAYFGEKDAQQLRVVRRMALDLDTGVEVVAVPTVREPDGLACSSRNVYLSPQERRSATVLYRALQAARSLYEQGERNAEALRQAMRAVLAEEALVTGVDYVSVADSETLEELEWVDRPALLSLAVRIGQTRLIDNLTIGG